MMNEIGSDELSAIDGGLHCWGAAIVWGDDVICIGVSY